MPFWETRYTMIYRHQWQYCIVCVQRRSIQETDLTTKTRKKRARNDGTTCSDSKFNKWCSSLCTSTFTQFIPIPQRAKICQVACVHKGCGSHDAGAWQYWQDIRELPISSNQLQFAISRYFKNASRDQKYKGKRMASQLHSTMPVLPMCRWDRREKRFESDWIKAFLSYASCARVWCFFTETQRTKPKAFRLAMMLLLLSMWRLLSKRRPNLMKYWER